MELKLSTRGDYLLRTAIALGHAQAGEYRKVREVAEEMGLPVGYAPYILGLLMKAGLAESRAGQHGGYRLIKAPEDITLLELVEAAEGQLWPSRCALDGGPCHWQESCAVHPAWERAYRALADVLRSETLAAVLDEDRLLLSGAAISRLMTHPLPRRVNGRQRPPDQTPA